MTHETVEPPAQRIAEWTASDTSISDVSTAVTDLWRSEGRPRVVTATQTLLVVVDDDAQAAELRETALCAARHSPGRLLIVTRAKDSEPERLDAGVRLWMVSAPRPMVVEEIELVIGGRLADHLTSMVTPFLLPDVPVVLWGPCPASDAESLIVLADRLICDTEGGGAASDRWVRDGGGTLSIEDLCWIRLRPWRRMVAGVFDTSSARPFVRGITHARIAGPPWQARLLAGWLASRLHLAPGCIEVVDGDEISATFEAQAGDRSGLFSLETVEVAPGRTVVRTSAAISGGTRCTRTLTIDDPEPREVLGRALVGCHDGFYLPALAMASAFVR